MKFSCCSPRSIPFTISCVTLIHLFSLTPVTADTAAHLDNNLDAIEIPVPLPENNSPGICSNYIEPVIDQIVEHPSLEKVKWAILVQSLSGSNIYSRNPDSYMVPASNMKLLVTAAALQKLNPDGQIRSTSIRDWITVTNLKSDNDYANVLLRYVGGSQSVQQALTNLGIDSNGYRLKDGSGLSRNNLATPRTLTSTLRAMFDARGNDVFLASLPIAGISGTLRNRLRHTTAEGTVRAKTGTLRGVKALSGYIDHPEYGVFVFSIITNQPTNQSNYAVVEAIDEIVLRLSTITKC
ncbi:D-alanyl-D-alanine carboxypeptidase/D-alanyl-D-alanine-endopeptidase [Pleurocapsa sp. PCC 7319]|uniref:D-alanyl-D-alanine carboxypeptidase/D-alanyl-D-alanine endopeptidase n=1 Tax=Pleurocapsa sp. PCC 7319 TaxID=118161 RepID=UPI0003478421|nr:D-alanyl-D-alanine carboxypeptidase/D-alanyl-D-alanine-endopeptidase [Pleurocapsa sp. PCC 7319]